MTKAQPENKTKRSDSTARFMRAYQAASQPQKRAIETAVVMLTSGATVELTQTVAVKLADLWGESGAQKS